jgi:hypothetical protein
MKVVEGEEEDKEETKLTRIDCSGYSGNALV